MLNGLAMKQTKKRMAAKKAMTRLLILSLLQPQKILERQTRLILIPDLCPPPPDYLINKVSAAGTDREALTNALMSWYMAGYHTGFYQGLMAQRTENPKNPTSGTKKNEKI
uniref:Survival motor neuron Tudor domain-containing protein n=1 Tax=Meloidogyne incognita TaxID=6306 RepID=A0A914LUD3_MELIC